MIVIPTTHPPFVLLSLFFKLLNICALFHCIQVGKAFFCATVLVFGGAILTFEFVASKLELHNVSNVHLMPRFSIANI